MSLRIPIPGEVLPNILEIPMPGSNEVSNIKDKGIPRLSDIPVPFETHSPTPVMLAAKYEGHGGSGRITHQYTENVSVYSGHTTEIKTAVNNFEDSNVNTPHASVPSPPVTPKVTLLGVENARKRLKAFCIQKKQSSLLSSTGSPKSPAPLSPSAGSLLIGKKMLHGSIKKVTPVQLEMDAQDKTKLPPGIKKIAVKKESEYERRRTSLIAMKMLSSEIDVKQALSKLGVPLSLLPPVEAYQAKPAPIKGMPFRYSRYLYPSEIELLVRKASLIEDSEFCNIAVPVDQEIKDLIESLKVDLNPCSINYDKKKQKEYRDFKDRIRQASYSSSGNNEPNEDISMEDLVVCDSWSLENDSNQMEVDFTEDSKVRERITEKTMHHKDGAKKRADAKSKTSQLPTKPNLSDPIIDMFSFDTEKSSKDVPILALRDVRNLPTLSSKDAKAIKLSTSDSNDFSSEIYSPADSSSSLEEAIAFAANLSKPHNMSNVDEESQNAVDNDFDSNHRDILHLESYYSPDMISSGDTTPIIKDGKIINRLDVQKDDSKKTSKVDDGKKQSSGVRDDGEKRKDKKTSSRDNSNSNSRSSFKEGKERERSREIRSRRDDSKSKSDKNNDKYTDKERNKSRRESRGRHFHSPQIKEKSKDKRRDSSKESHKDDHPKAKESERDRDGSQSSQVSIKISTIKENESSKQEDRSPSKNLQKIENEPMRSKEETESRKARWDKNPLNPKNMEENNLDVWSTNSQSFVKETPFEDKGSEKRVDKKKDKKGGMRQSKMSEEAEKGWKMVEEVCARKVHSDTKCHRWTSFSPAIEFCENLSSCNCGAPKIDNRDSLMAMVAAILSEEQAEKCDASQEPSSQGWYPSVEYLLTGKFTVELSTNWETDDSLSQNESRMKRNIPSLLLTTDNLAKFDTANTAESLKNKVKTNAKTKLCLIDVSAIPTPVEKPEISAAVPSLDLEYEKFMEAVWPEIAEKSPTDLKADAKSKSGSVSLSIECNESMKNYFRSDDTETPKSKPFDESGMDVDSRESVKDKRKEGVVSVEVLGEGFELALGTWRGDGKKKEMLNKEDSENWSESDTEVKKIVKKKTNSSSIKPATRRKGHAKISSRRKKGKKDSAHRKKNSSVSSSGTAASSSATSSTSSSSSSSSSDSSGSSDSIDKRKVKKKKSRTSLSKSKKKNKKRLSKAKELARKQRLKKKRKEKKKVLKERQTAKLKGKRKGEEKKKDEPYSSDDQELKTDISADKVKKVKKTSSKTSAKKLASKRKGREPERDKKKKRRKRQESSSSSSSSDSETMRKVKSKKKIKKRSSNAGSINSSQHSSKKRRKTTDDDEIDPVLADQFSMQTVLNIKLEKTSEDEMEKVTEEFSPRINRMVHTQEIISVNELHSDFVESSKKNVIIPDAVVKIEPPAIEVIQEVQETSLPKDESERFSIESEHSNSTTSFASLRNSLSFEHNSNDSNVSAQSSDNNSMLNSESPCENSMSSLKNDVEINRGVELAEESPVKKAAGHFESVAKSMHSDSNSMIESTLGRGKDSSNIECIKDIPNIIHSLPVLNVDSAKAISDIVSRPKEISSTEPSQEAVTSSVEKVTISQVPVTVAAEKPKSSGVGLVSLQDIEKNRRAVEEFDRLKREFEEFTRERLNVSNMSAERLAAAEELKRQFDMVENYDLPVVTKPVAETKPILDIRPIPTVTGIAPQDSCSRLTSQPVRGEIKWDWRPDSSHGSMASRSRRPSRWGVTPQPEMQNSALIEVELKSDSELRLPNTNTNPLGGIPTPCTPDDEPSDDKIYKIQTISTGAHEPGGGSGNSYHMDGMAAEYEESYDMYSEERGMNSVFGLEEAATEDEEARAKKISLDDRISLVLQYPGLSAVGGVTNGASSPSPPLCVIKPSPDKGILVVAGVKITRLDPRTAAPKVKRVCFSDGLAPGQDSDEESAATPAKVCHPQTTKSRQDGKKKKRSKVQCGGHAYPCPPSWPSYSPRWDSLPPPPPPPGSPPPQLYQPRCSLMTSTVMNAPDAFITRLPKIPSHTEIIG